MHKYRKNIKDIKNVYENANKINNLNDINIDFFEEEYNIDKIIEIINIFGNINQYNNNYQYKFKNWPKNKNENQKFFNISGDENIFTVTSKNNEWVSVICQNKLENNKEYKWKIKILKTLKNYIKIGVVTNEYYDILSYDRKYGFFYECDNNCLYSGKPHEYNGKNACLDLPKKEIIIIMDMKIGSLKFIIDGVDKGESYKDIPTNKPLFPGVFLKHFDDSIQILSC